MKQNNHNEDFQRGKKKKKKVDCLVRGKVCDTRNREEWLTHVKQHILFTFH